MSALDSVKNSDLLPKTRSFVLQPGEKPPPPKAPPPRKPGVTFTEAPKPPQAPLGAAQSVKLKDEDDVPINKTDAPLRPTLSFRAKPEPPKPPPGVPPNMTPSPLNADAPLRPTLSFRAKPEPPKAPAGPNRGGTTTTTAPLVSVAGDNGTLDKEKLKQTKSKLDMLQSAIKEQQQKKQEEEEEEDEDDEDTDEEEQVVSIHEEAKPSTRHTLVIRPPPATAASGTSNGGGSLAAAKREVADQQQRPAQRPPTQYVSRPPVNAGGGGGGVGAARPPINSTSSAAGPGAARPPINSTGGSARPPANSMGGGFQEIPATTGPTPEQRPGLSRGVGGGSFHEMSVSDAGGFRQGGAFPIMLGASVPAASSQPNHGAVNRPPVGGQRPISTTPMQIPAQVSPQQQQPTPTQSAAQQQGAVWQVLWSQEYNTQYWYNTVSGVSTWEDPANAAVAAAAAAAAAAVASRPQSMGMHGMQNMPIQGARPGSMSMGHAPTSRTAQLREDETIFDREKNSSRRGSIGSSGSGSSSKTKSLRSTFASALGFRKKKDSDGSGKEDYYDGDKPKGKHGVEVVKEVKTKAGRHTVIRSKKKKHEDGGEDDDDDDDGPSVFQQQPVQYHQQQQQPQQHLPTQQQVMHVRAIYDYPYDPNNPSVMYLRAGDVIAVNYQGDDGWWSGVCQSDGRSGYFPANYVQYL